MPGAAAIWSGRAELGPGWAAFAGRAGDNRVHSHPALQLALGEAAPVRAEVAGRAVRAHGLLIGAGVPHALRPGPVRLIYLERESVAGHRLAAACRDGLRCLGPDECAQLAALCHAKGPGAAAVAALVDALAGDAPAALGAPAVPRLQTLLAALPQRAPEAWSFAALAAEAGLSGSRFAHAFKAQTGLAVRPYLRWLRLARALQTAGAGHSLTEAAHAAGFADAAHFSRTMRRHFGIAPVAVLAALRRD